MNRLVAGALVFVALTQAQAIPVRQPAAPMPPTPPMMDIRDTTWQGKDHVDNYRITFESDGTLTYGYNNSFHRGGTWKFDGVHLYWEVNGKYRETKATLNGTVIQGDSWNVTGKRWQTQLLRIK